MNPYLNFALHFKNKKWAPHICELTQKMQDGNICLDTTQPLSNYTNDLFGSIKIIDENPETDIIGHPKKTNVPFILDGNLLYFQRYYNYEIGIYDNIQERISNTTIFEDNIAFLQKNRSILPPLYDTSANEVNFQNLAILNSFLQPFSIITGGPGTGKTTTVTNLLKLCLLQNPFATIAIAAPTGKASSRLIDSIHAAATIEALDVKNGLLQTKGFTIHRLLGYQRNSIYFKHNNENQLKFDVIVIDECSMIDAALFYKLLTAIPSTTKLVLVGDKNQLASVEAGSIFGDICNSIKHTNNFTKKHIDILTQLYPESASHLNKLCINDNEKSSLLSNYLVELQKSFRFDDHEGIGVLSKAIIQNNNSQLSSLLNTISDQYSFELDENWAFIENFISNYQKYIQATTIKEALVWLNAYKVLCVNREGVYGVKQINIYIEKFLSQLTWIVIDQPYYHNMPIMVTQNNYDLGLFNGDIGIIRKDENNQLKAWFVDNQTGAIISYAPYLISNFELAYAMTIHKSQGSEFDHVLLLVNSNKNDNNLLSRELLYTGITRAKKHVAIFSTKEIIEKACATKVNRSSGLSKRLS